jgi:hypothetical protein
MIYGWCENILTNFGIDDGSIIRPQIRFQKSTSGLTRCDVIRIDPLKISGINLQIAMASWLV